MIEVSTIFSLMWGGGVVMHHDKTEKLNRNPGLRPKWNRPDIIVQSLSPAIEVIWKLAGHKASTVHVDRLKHYFPTRKQCFKWAKKLLRKTHPHVKLDCGETETSETESFCDSDSIGLGSDVVDVIAGPNWGQIESDISGGSGFSSEEATE